MTKFMPAEFELIEARQPPLKDMYDEWLARIICYPFSVPASAFVSQVNRATGETLRMQATQEGLVPLKNWIKSALDRLIQDCMTSVKRHGFRALEQNTNIFLTAYSRFPVAQTFMIWSLDWASAWSRSPFALTELSTLVFHDHVLVARPQDHLASRPKRIQTCGASSFCGRGDAARQPEKGEIGVSTRGDGPSGNALGVRSAPAASDLSLLSPPGKDDLNPASSFKDQTKFFPRVRNLGRMSFQ
jgi:hypothetical protein